MESVVFIGLAALAFLILSGMGQAASDSTSQDSGTGSAPVPADNSIPGGNDNVPDPGTGQLAGAHITNDINTWPTGDRVWDVCRAIAHAEGANVAGSVPDRFNNPGDISDGHKEFSQTFTDGSYVTMFPDKATGWSWLYSKVFNAASGQSSVYSPDMTWEQIAHEWAGNWDVWATNVSSYLGVSRTSTLNDYVGFQQVNI